MYFVRYRVVCARYTGEWDQKSLPQDTYYFDYDDESRWSPEDLQEALSSTDYDGYNEDVFAHVAVVTELRRRKDGTDDYLCEDWEEVLERLTEEDDEEDGEEDGEEEEKTGLVPLLYPEDLSLPARKMISDAAKLEHEELAFRRKVAALKPGDIGDDMWKEFKSLDRRGNGIRADLLHSSLGKGIPPEKEPLEYMKAVAARLFFLYSHTRMHAEILGGEPEEDFYYAASNLYAHAMADQEQGKYSLDNNDVSALFDQFEEYGPDKGKDE